MGNNGGLFVCLDGVGRGAMWGSRRGIKDQKSIDIINTARANKNFFKKSFYVIPAFSDFFFFSKLAFIWLRVFFFLSHLFFLRFSHFFLFDYCVPKKVTKWYKKEKGLSNDVSLTITFLLLHIHSIGRGGKVGFIFVLFWESLWVKLLQRLEKKRLRKWLICESLFFHEVMM